MTFLLEALLGLSNALSIESILLTLAPRSLTGWVVGIPLHGPLAHSPSHLPDCILLCVRYTTWPSGPRRVGSFLSSVSQFNWHLLQKFLQTSSHLVPRGRPGLILAFHTALFNTSHVCLCLLCNISPKKTAPTAMPGSEWELNKYLLNTYPSPHCSGPPLIAHVTSWGALKKKCPWALHPGILIGCIWGRV